MKKIILFQLILQSALMGLMMSMTLPIFADTTNEEPSDKRENLMKEMGNHMKALKKILGGATDAGNVKEHAAAMEYLTRDLYAHLNELFPKGSDAEESSALPAIWQNWEDFKNIAQSATVKSVNLLTATSNGNSEQITEAYKELGAVCKNCHKDYRSEK